MDYKNKYLKYKKKYLELKNQTGGHKVPLVLPETQSWFFMPILLKPFEEDIEVVFPDEFYEINYPDIGLIPFNNINNYLIDFYNSKNINLSTRFSLIKKLGVEFDDKHSLHLRPTDQEKILNDLFFENNHSINLKFQCDAYAEIIVNDYPDIDFIFKLKR